MKRRKTANPFLATLFAAALAVTPAAAGWRNGTRFDPGVERTGRAAGAPPQLDLVADSIGQYDVEVTTFVTDGEPVVSRGRSEITFINRGHAMMESFHGDDVDGHPLSSLMFLGFHPASGRWFLAGADSWSESAWVADGGFDDASRLVLATTARPNGGIGRTRTRYVFTPTDDAAPDMRVERSDDGGANWYPVERRVYSRRPPATDFLAPASRYGSPHPDRPAAAAAFDFLIGEWDESHDMTLPGGQRIRWRANGTGVYVLDGAAVLEFSWFDADPSLPDAATTVLRLYNRAMRRWECLYVPNRGHGILYFGGVQEGDRIVLTNFGTHTAAGPLSHYVFHAIGEDSYAWYAERSSDRGASWAKTWTIQARRKPEASEEAADGAANEEPGGASGEIGPLEAAQPGRHR